MTRTDGTGAVLPVVVILVVGKIGEDGDPFFIGNARAPLRVRGSGRLYLGINDDFLQDNSGSLRVVIAY